MARKFALPMSLVCLLLSGTIISCGGGSSTGGGGGCTGGPYNVVGDWMLTVAGGGSSSSGPGVINSAGLAVFFQTTTATPAPGDTVVLPTITGSCSFSGNASAYGTPGSGGGSATRSVQGKVNSSTSITGTLSNGNTLSLVPNPPLSGSVTALSGQMLGEIEGATQAAIWQFTLSSTGTGASMSISGTDNQGCNASGTFTQDGTTAANLNVFDVAINFTGTGCPTNTLNGLGFESNSDYFQMNGGAVGIYLYAASSSSANALEIFP